MDDPVGSAIRLIDDVRDVVTPATRWPATGTLPDMSFEGALKRAAFGQSIQARIAALDRDRLPRSLAQTVDVIALRADYWVVQADWYWTVFDPGGADMFGMFAPTAYCGGMTIASLTNALARVAVGTEADRFRYLAGLAEFGDVLDQLAARTPDDGDVSYDQVSWLFAA